MTSLHTLRQEIEKELEDIYNKMMALCKEKLEYDEFQRRLQELITSYSNKGIEYKILNKIESLVTSPQPSTNGGVSHNSRNSAYSTAPVDMDKYIEKKKVLEKVEQLESDVRFLHNVNTHDDGFGLTNSSGESELLEAINKISDFKEELKKELGVEE